MIEIIYSTENKVKFIFNFYCFVSFLADKFNSLNTSVWRQQHRVGTTHTERKEADCLLTYYYMCVRSIISIFKCVSGWH